MEQQLRGNLDGANGTMEHSQSVGPQRKSPRRLTSHLMMSPLHQGLTPSQLGPDHVAAASGIAHSERGAYSGHGASELIRAGCPLAASTEPCEALARAVRWRSDGSWRFRFSLLTSCAPFWNRQKASTTSS